MRRSIAIVLVAAVGGGLAGGSIGFALDNHDAGATTTAPAVLSTSASRPAVSSRPSRDRLTPEEIYKKDAPSVVVITDTQTERVPPSLFSPQTQRQVQALGSGFVIDRQGDIVTNDHVVQGASHIRVGFTGGASYPATVAGEDASTDIAVVRVDAPASALRPLAFEGSTKVQVGDRVYAIGNPFGLDRTMTAGIVSAIGRDIQAPNGLTIPNAIQTDAPINHGNSGGPLLDRFGRVVGINAQIEGGTVDANVGVGFAVPSDTARSVADQLISDGHVDHAWLGVQVETIDPIVAAAVRGLPPHGVVVVKLVKGGPAAKAGLRAASRKVTVNGVTAFVGGDVIEKVDGNAVSTAAQLADLVAQSKPGDTVTLEVIRAGVTRQVEVTLGTVPAGG
jgi:S1-C subfamily serine protease